VTVDPGYVGSVEVNSHRVRRHSLSEDAPVPGLTPDPAVTPAAPVVAPGSSPSAIAPAVAANEAASPAQAPAPSTTTPAVAVTPAPAAPQTDHLSAPATLASQLAPSMLDQGQMPANGAPVHSAESVAATSSYVSPVAQIAQAPAPVKLYWSEPVTGPDGQAPVVAANEIRLVEVHGNASIVMSNGETLPGVEDMLVPSGATVITSENSSAALFMGGVDSARLMPRCRLMVTQVLGDSVRKIVLDLDRGAVFSRVGQRDGEMQDFQVRTPEGIASATTNEMLSFRGSLDDLDAPSSASALGWDHRRLLAWIPAASTTGAISDSVSSWLPSIMATPLDHALSTYHYYVRSSSAVEATKIQHQVLTSTKSTGMAEFSVNDSAKVLQSVMTMLQPFNVKLNSLIMKMDRGMASPADKSYYHQLITVFFGQQLPSILQSNSGKSNAVQNDILQSESTLRQDLKDFYLSAVTPS
jgi:hypothetical protein